MPPFSPVARCDGRFILDFLFPPIISLLTLQTFCQWLCPALTASPWLGWAWPTVPSPFHQSLHTPVYQQPTIIIHSLAAVFQHPIDRYLCQNIVLLSGIHIFSRSLLFENLFCLTLWFLEPACAQIVFICLVCVWLCTLSPMFSEHYETFALWNGGFGWMWPQRHSQQQYSDKVWYSNDDWLMLRDPKWVKKNFSTALQQLGKVVQTFRMNL